MFLELFLIIIGLVILIVGAEALVRGSASIAKRMNIPPLVIGLTIVAFGTSAPEMIVNILSAVRGASDLALGNILGSNISNILLILGIAAIINPIEVQKSTVYNEIPFSLLAAIVLLILGSDVKLAGASADVISLPDSLILLSFFSIFLYYVIGMSRRKKNQNDDAEEIQMYTFSISLLMTILGMIFLAGGGQLLVDNAVILAQKLEISEALIGLTIISIGTSLPELATAVVAALRKQNDIAIGNVVGSNIFNIFWILGLTGMFAPLSFSSYTGIDLLMVMVSTIILFTTFYTGKKHTLEKNQGIFLLILYIAYLIYIIMRG